MTGDSNHNVEGLAKSRIEALSDGIFAISMTLLVLSLTVPAIAESDAPDLLPGLIAGMYPDFLFFAIAFFILGGYWMAHHRILQSVEYVDEQFIWLNLFLLFFIVLIPFSTSLSGDYENVLFAVLLFHVNLLVASLMLSGIWLYTRRYFRIKDLDKAPGFSPPGAVDSVPPRVYIIPAVIMLAIAVSFFDTYTSMMCYLLMPVIVAVANHLPRRESAAI
ncbi:MAG TPA: TMEM175 family protein [Methanoregulaceae archaeon]|jgi:uncharacterized membrane protein|nr:DUF1211 domain-containing protein [Methanoregulaceae archaeon]MDD5047753.1 TMEM175 family protein [Methanoregulaceae archaeon]HOP66157.1 TMEM175 family protein [Methanoregulaceae archaeon]HPJ73459.1 TMEM175 family protein [Methanoregulaceae archaeon]HPQ75029.1 TMEM175 family protein [Methanoregulaceae archaeon]